MTFNSHFENDLLNITGPPVHLEKTVMNLVSNAAESIAGPGEDDRGTVFTLFFPITREELSEDQKPLSPEIYQGRGESILVVDDVKEQ